MSYDKEYEPSMNCFKRLRYSFDWYNLNQISSKASSTLIEHFEGLQKNIISKSEAMWYWGNYLSRFGIKYSGGDIQEAYDLCYGEGCEFEWDLE